MRSTRTGEQDGGIIRRGLGKAATPFVDHGFRTPDGSCQLLTSPIGMQLQESAQVSSLAHPKGFHGEPPSLKHEPCMIIDLVYRRRRGMKSKETNKSFSVCLLFSQAS